MKTLKITLFSLLIALPVVNAGTPSITITYAPPMNINGPVYMQVQNVDRTNYGVAFFIEVMGTWWTKPYWTPNVWPIDTNNQCNLPGYWTGGIDFRASHFAAFVVPLAYSNTIPQLNGVYPITAEIYSNSIANTFLDRRTSDDFVRFSGIDWEKKSTVDPTYNWGGTWDPGNNWWGPSNAWVDANGKLHLVILYSNSFWSCAEVISSNSMGYGLYRFRVDSDISSLSTQIVLGMFTWSDDPGNGYHREIDVEFSRGPVVGNGGSNVWQNVVQPWNTPGNRYQFPAATDKSKSVHEFLWLPSSVSFNGFTTFSNDVLTYVVLGATNVDFSGSRLSTTQQVFGATNATVALDMSPEFSSKGFVKANLDSLSGSPAPFESHAFSNSIPQAGGENIHLNLWINNDDTSALTGQMYEVVLSGFDFIPLSNLRPVLGISSVGTNKTDITLEYPGN